MSADPRVVMLKAAMSQHGGGMPIQVFRGTTRYQYGSGVGNILGSIWRFMYPVILRGAASFIKHGGDAYLAQGNVKEALKAGIKPAIGTMIKSAGDELASRVEAPTVSAHSSEVGTALIPKQLGCGHVPKTRRRRRALSFGVYKDNAKRARTINYPESNFSKRNF
jgi:hypothetical protein